MANGVKLLQNAGLIDTGDFGESGTGRKTQDGMLIGNARERAGDEALGILE